jgi:hypothetical protein
MISSRARGPNRRRDDERLPVRCRPGLQFGGSLYGPPPAPFFHKRHIVVPRFSRLRSVLPVLRPPGVDVPRKPGSRRSPHHLPSAISFMTSNTFIIGPGHWRPLQSRRMAARRLRLRFRTPDAGGPALLLSPYVRCRKRGPVLRHVSNSCSGSTDNISCRRIEPDILEAVLLQDAGGGIGPHADRAEDNELAGFVQFPSRARSWPSGICTAPRQLESRSSASSRTSRMQRARAFLPRRPGQSLTLPLRMFPP